MEKALAFFVSFLPRRYWRGAEGLGIFFSGLLQLGLSLAGLVSTYTHFASEVSDIVAEATVSAAIEDPSTGGRVVAGHAMALGALTPIGFLAVSRKGQVFAYLVLSAVVRLLGYACDHPWGDPLLTFVDDVFRGAVDSLTRGARSVSRAAWSRWVG